jgi:dipeptidyl aminopeptidase/acylaminoacyl peptidase
MRFTKFTGALLAAASYSVVPVASAHAEEAAIMSAAATVSATAAETAQPAIIVTGMKGRVDTAVFGKRPFMRGPRLSPDGNKIAVMMSKNGVDNLGWIDVTKPGSPPTFFLAAEEQREVGDRSVAGWRWVGNRTIVYTLTSRESLNGGRIDMARLVGYDVETGKMTPLAWEQAGANGARIMHIDDEKESFLVQRDSIKDGVDYNGSPEVIEVNARTGKYKIVQRPNVEISQWIADGKGVIRAGVGGGGGDSGKQRLMYRSDANGTFKTVSNEADTTFTGTQIYPEIFLDEPDLAYATSNKDGFRKVYKINVKTMQIVGEPVFGVKGYDVGGLAETEDGNDLAGVGYTSNKARVRWFDPRLAQIQKFLDDDFGRGNAQIISSNDGNTKLVVFKGKTNEPGGYFLYDTESGRMQLLGWVHPVLKDAELNPMDSIRYKASDGMEIEAVVTYPRHRPHRKNLPVIVMPHGGPFGIRDSEEFGFFPWHQAMAELGYVVIQPNYRGSGGYGKEFVKEGRKPEGYGLRMQDDLNDALTWFGQTGLVDPTRACLMGWSYGGYASARGAQRDADKWRCAIAGAGYYDMVAFKSFDTRTFGSFGASYQASGDDLKKISAMNYVDQKWAPLLFVGAVRDARIPIDQHRTLASKLKGAGKKEGVDFRYVEQPKGTHNLPYEDVHTEWLLESEAWARKHNPPYIAADPDKEPTVTVTLNSGGASNGKTATK